MAKEYIVVMPRVEGNPDAGYSCVYYSDNHRFPSLPLVKRHGMEDLCQSDDFLIGVVEGDVLLSLQWMDERRDDRDEVVSVAACLGLSTSDEPSKTDHVQPEWKQTEGRA